MTVRVLVVVPGLMADGVIGNSPASFDSLLTYQTALSTAATGLMAFLQQLDLRVAPGVGQVVLAVERPGAVRVPVSMDPKSVRLTPGITEDQVLSRV